MDLDLLHADLQYIRKKVDKLDENVAKIDKDLAVHKVTTGRIALFVGGLSSLLVAIAAALLKGCA